MRINSRDYTRLVLATLTMISVAGFADAQSALNLSKMQQSQLCDLASRILRHADAAGCKKDSCTILVGNFAGLSGATTPLGMQLADALSSELASEAKGIRVVDRNRLQEYLVRERIESKLLEDDNAARWLAQENGANFVLVGYLRGDAAQKNLHVQLLDTRDFGKKNAKSKGRAEEATFNDLGFSGDLDQRSHLESYRSCPAQKARLSIRKPRKARRPHRHAAPTCPIRRMRNRHEW